MMSSMEKKILEDKINDLMQANNDAKKQNVVKNG